jgi:hypothetical protein
MCLLSLFFVTITLQSNAAMKSHKKKAKGVENAMTVAAIRPANTDETFVKVTFNQSQRFYKLPNDSNPKYLELLKESEKKNIPVIIKRASEQSDIILEVKASK